MNRLYRSRADKLLGGVCGGLAEYLHIDPLVVRLLFVLGAMINGIGLAAYMLLWLFVPAADTAFMTQEDVVRQNAEEIRARALTLGQETQTALNTKLGQERKIGGRMLVGGVVLVAVGLLLLLDNLGLLWWFSLGKLWPLILVAVGAVILLNNLKDKH
jgi:phage shock protein PspC (stress-responsive transcriptional regulator)